MARRHGGRIEGRSARRGRLARTGVVAALIVLAVVALTVERTRSKTTAAGSTAASTDPASAPLGDEITMAPASSAAARTPSPVVPPEITPAAVRMEGNPADIAAQVADLTAAVGASGVSIAALNTATGATFSYGASGGMNTGSIVKLDILETLLLQHQDANTPLSSAEVSEATTMIENSNNDSAQDLWVDVGSDPAVTLANKRLGAVNTVAGTDDYWGLTTTDGADQVALLKNLVETGGPLSSASQSFALNLMDNVESDQRWGVGVIADPGTTFANKNGWLAVDDDNDLWLVNSDGIVTVGGQQVLISVLTQHDATEASGISLVEAIARTVAPAVS